MTSAQCSVALLPQVDDLFGLKEFETMRLVYRVVFADADIWAATSWYPSITHRAVFYEFMHEIFTLCTVGVRINRRTQLHRYHSCVMPVKVPPHRLRFFFLSSANKRFAGVAIRSRSIKSTFAKTPPEGRRAGYSMQNVYNVFGLIVKKHRGFTWRGVFGRQRRDIGGGT